MESIITTSPVGNLEISLADDCLLGLIFTRKQTTPKAQIPALAQKVIVQLEHYFENANYQFDLPLQLNGTPFQQKVWRALQKIPTGSTLTYGELATKLNTSARAIGNACRTNPITIIVPCHRIVGQKGLTGYAGQTSGAGIKTKNFLLDHEQAVYSR